MANVKLLFLMVLILVGLSFLGSLFARLGRYAYQKHQRKKIFVNARFLSVLVQGKRPHPDKGNIAFINDKLPQFYLFIIAYLPYLKGFHFHVVPVYSYFTPIVKTNIQPLSKKEMTARIACDMTIHGAKTRMFNTGEELIALMKKQEVSFIDYNLLRFFEQWMKQSLLQSEFLHLDGERVGYLLSI